MIFTELEYRCVTCNIELIVFDAVFSSGREHVQNDLKKLYKHQRKGHKITSKSRSIFHDVYGFTQISDNDIITKYILENKTIVIP